MRWGVGLTVAGAVVWASVVLFGEETAHRAPLIAASAPATAPVALVAAQGGDLAEGGETCVLRQADRTRTPATACLACHDGTIGPGIAFQMRADGLGASHPVDVDYGAAAAKRPGEYVPRSQLPPGVPLVEGKVACTSCHDGQSTEPHHVANHQQLCLSCHIK